MAILSFGSVKKLLSPVIYGISFRLYDGLKNCNSSTEISSKLEICLNVMALLTINVSVAKRLAMALFGTMPCSL